MTHNWRQDRSPKHPTNLASGDIVYVILPDRYDIQRGYDPAVNLKRFHPEAILRPWNELPKRGPMNKELGICEHEREFWGGTLRGVTGRLGYIKWLGATAIHMTPVTRGRTNHRYDSNSHPLEIDPALGNEGDLKELARQCDLAGIKLALDVVPNHLGTDHPFVQAALKDPTSPYRALFDFRPTPEDPNHHVRYFDVPSLHEINLESDAAKDYLYRGEDSVLVRHLKWGARILRVDSADLIGPAILREMTQAVHRNKPGAWLVGEIWSYPGSMWSNAVDGQYNGFLGDLVVQISKSELPGGVLGRAVERMVEDAGLDYVLRSWITIANHDAHRLADQVPVPQQASVARTLLFTLPGSPTLYYGDELGMRAHPQPGEESDPISRAPMRWDLVTDDNPILAETRRLTTLRQAYPALRHGDYVAVETDQLVAFLRTVPDVAGSVLVVVNPTSEPVTEPLILRDSRLLAYTTFVDRLGRPGRRLRSAKGPLKVRMEPYEALVLTPDLTPFPGGFERYKRARYGEAL